MKVVIIKTSVKCGGELYEEGKEYDLSKEICEEIEGYYEPVKERPKATPKPKAKEKPKTGEGYGDNENDNNGGKE